MNKFNRGIKTNKLLIVFLMMVCVFIVTSCDTSTKELSGGKMRVHFLDIGQGDSELIELPNGEVMLIDGGNRDDSEFLVEYIKNLHISKIDYVVATHPHEDHIGGLPEVIKTFDIGKIYMPKKTANTRIFESLVSEIKNKGLKITEANSGMNILDEKDLNISILAPISTSYEKINDYSIVSKLKYKDISLLFAGDAERESEKQLLQSEMDLSADLLKIGHHGSNTSSSDEFLDEVKPKYAVISSEKGNNYGHPHKEVIDRLTSRNIKILRTDEMGTIVLETDGKAAKLKSLKK